MHCVFFFKLNLHKFCFSRIWSSNFVKQHFESRHHPIFHLIRKLWLKEKSYTYFVVMKHEGTYNCRQNLQTVTLC